MRAILLLPRPLDALAALLLLAMLCLLLWPIGLLIEGVEHAKKWLSHPGGSKVKEGDHATVS